MSMFDVPKMTLHYYSVAAEDKKTKKSWTIFHTGVKKDHLIFLCG